MTWNSVINLLGNRGAAYAAELMNMSEVSAVKWFAMSVVIDRPDIVLEFDRLNYQDPNCSVFSHNSIVDDALWD